MALSRLTRDLVKGFLALFVARRLRDPFDVALLDLEFLVRVGVVFDHHFRAVFQPPDIAGSEPGRRASIGSVSLITDMTTSPALICWPGFT